MFKKEKCYLSGIIQQPVNASSRKIGVKTARLGVDGRPEVCMDLILDILDLDSRCVRQEPD